MHASPASPGVRPSYSHSAPPRRRRTWGQTPPARTSSSLLPGMEVRREGITRSHFLPGQGPSGKFQHCPEHGFAAEALREIVVKLCMSRSCRPSLAIRYEKQASASPTPNGSARVYAH